MTRITAHMSWLLVLVATTPTSAQWRPANPRIMSRWAHDVSPDAVHQEHPRPQLVRDNWINLNGLWDYAILPREAGQPNEFPGSILVPFAVESALSGVGQTVTADQRLWYRRVLPAVKLADGERLLLHFGAIDWQAHVSVDGREVGAHAGGYDAFTVDITDAVHDGDQHELVVAVWDPTDASWQPRGKQVARPQGIWYTAVTGIWQTVWLEKVPSSSIQQLKLVPHADAGTLSVTVTVRGPSDGLRVQAVALDQDVPIARAKGQVGEAFDVPIANPKLWSPESPFLYDLQLSLTRGSELVDEVTSYFGMRKISLGRDEQGLLRLMLNNQPLFQYGTLDQGWWPDGLYTAPTDEALRYDIEVTRKLGFNMARKHVKIEPDRWYYHCDKLGLLVWQDMPSGDRYIGHDDPDITRSEESARQFERELMRLIEGRGNHPSIVVWVPFNEGWGQFDTPRITSLIKQTDPSRLVVNTSGWADRRVGDIHDIHAYPGPAMPPLEDNRAAVLGEFGGLGLPISGHTWQDDDNWGYRSFQNAPELTDAYSNLLKHLHRLRSKGLAAAVYTQTTDVEIEVNGLMTYDRAIIKMDVQQMRRAAAGYVPPMIESDDDKFVDTATIHITNMGPRGSIRYTTDGSDPGRDAPAYAGPLTLTASATVKARLFWPDGTHSALSEFACEKIAYLSAPRDNVAQLAPGLRYRYYEVRDPRWQKTPAFSRLDVTASGVTPQMDLAVARRDTNFAIEFEGFIHVKRDGLYCFHTMSDDGSILTFGEHEVVNNDFNHGMVEKSGKIALRAGVYPLRLTFYQGLGGKGLEVSYEGPGIQKQSISSDMLFH